MSKPFFTSKSKDFIIYNDNYLNILSNIDKKFDMVYADPPYFLSSNGMTIQSGKIVSVKKGDWDKQIDYQQIVNFNRQWLELVKSVMKDSATIWISGTNHNIFTIIQIIKELDFKLLNVIVWEKLNPPPNFYTKIFKQSVEYIVFARKSKQHSHKFNHDIMKMINDGKRMTDVWKLPSIANWEKTYGKHPTQKPINLLARIILASTDFGDLILDPFSGSSTTGIAANLLNRKFVGVESEMEFCKLSIKRRNEISKEEVFNSFILKIKDLKNLV